MIRRYQYDSESLPVFTDPEAIHEANWWQPLSTPLPPKRIHVSQIPFTSFVEFSVPVPQIPMDSWFQPLSTPIPPPRIHPSSIPSLFWVYLPPVSGCIEIEYIVPLVPRATARPNMPIAYITHYDHWSANPPACATTRQSPGTQPQNNP